MKAVNAIDAPIPGRSDDLKWLLEARAALAEGGLDVDDDGYIRRNGNLTSLMLVPVPGGSAVYVRESGAGGAKYWRGSPSGVLAVVYWLLSYDGS